MKEISRKILIVYYSMHGHIYKMGQVVAQGVRLLEGVEVEFRRVPETLPEAALEKMSAVAVQQQAQVPICRLDELGTAEKLLFIHFLVIPAEAGGKRAERDAAAVFRA